MLTSGGKNCVMASVISMFKLFLCALMKCEKNGLFCLFLFIDLSALAAVNVLMSVIRQETESTTRRQT